MFKPGAYLRYLGGQINKQTVIVDKGEEVSIAGKLCQIQEVVSNNRLLWIKFPDIEKPLIAVAVESEFQKVDSWSVPVSWGMTAVIKLPKELYPELDDALNFVQGDEFPLSLINQNLEGTYLSDSFEVTEDFISEYNPDDSEA